MSYHFLIKILQKYYEIKASSKELNKDIYEHPDEVVVSRINY